MHAVELKRQPIVYGNYATSIISNLTVTIDGWEMLHLAPFSLKSLSGRRAMSQSNH